MRRLASSCTIYGDWDYRGLVACGDCRHGCIFSLGVIQESPENHLNVITESSLSFHFLCDLRALCGDSVHQATTQQLDLKKARFDLLRPRLDKEFLRHQVPHLCFEQVFEWGVRGELRPVTGQ